MKLTVTWEVTVSFYNCVYVIVAMGVDIKAANVVPKNTLAGSILLPNPENELSALMTILAALPKAAHLAEQPANWHGG